MMHKTQSLAGKSALAASASDSALFTFTSLKLPPAEQMISVAEVDTIADACPAKIDRAKHSSTQRCQSKKRVSDRNIETDYRVNAGQLFQRRWW